MLETRDGARAIELARRYPMERRYGEIAAILIEADPGASPALKLATLDLARANDPYSPRLAFWRVQAALKAGDREQARAALELMRRTAPRWPQTHDAAALLRSAVQ